MLGLEKSHVDRQRHACLGIPSWRRVVIYSVISVSCNIYWYHQLRCHDVDPSRPGTREEKAETGSCAVDRPKTGWESAAPTHVPNGN